MTTMTAQTPIAPPPTPTLPLVKFTAAVMTACKIAAIGTAAIAVAMHLATRTQDSLAASLGAGCVAAAAWAGVFILRAARGKPAQYIPIYVLGASGTRLILSLFLGVIVFVAIRPIPQPFWIALLVAGLFGLVVETAWVMSAVKKYNASIAAGRPGASSVTEASEKA